MQTEQLRKLMLKELPTLLRTDTAFRDVVLEIARPHFADKLETEHHFEEIFAKFDNIIEKHTLAIEKLSQRIEKQDQRLEKLDQLFDKLERRLEKLEQRLDLKIAEDRKRFEALELKLDQKIQEDREKWIQHDLQMSKFDQRLMAMGARWGSQSEEAFRNGLAAILKEVPDIEVIHVDEHDDEGVVFGYPEEIELDIIIKNGLLIIVEMKSATDKSDVYRFDKKARFYEQKHGHKASRKIIISPMVGKKAKPVAQKLGIELYTYVQNVKM